VLATFWQVDDLATALLMTRLYELHLEKGMAPAGALKAAQVWLRDATKAELIAYAKRAADIATLPRDKLTQLEDALSSRRRVGETRFALEDKAVAIAKAMRAALAEDDGSAARPFAHPIYWGGFVFTGL
jgi:CHAT domain-containing protein